MVLFIRGERLGLEGLRERGGGGGNMHLSALLSALVVHGPPAAPDEHQLSGPRQNITEGFYLFFIKCLNLFFKLLNLL